MDIVSVIKIITTVDIAVIADSKVLSREILDVFSETNFKLRDMTDMLLEVESLKNRRTIVLTNVMEAVVAIRGISDYIPILYIVHEEKDERIAEMTELSIDGYLMVPFAITDVLSVLLKIMPNIYDVFNEKANVKNMEVREKWLETIASNIYEGTIVVNEDYDIIFVNPAACNMLGYENNELQYQNISLISDDINVGLDKFILADAEIISEAAFKHKEKDKLLSVAMNIKIVTEEGNKYLVIVFEKKTSMKLLDERIAKQLKMQNVVMELLNAFMFGEDYLKSMHSAIHILGDLLDASRINISETIINEGESFGNSKSVYEWCNPKYESGDGNYIINTYSWDEPQFSGYYKELLRGFHSLLINPQRNLLPPGPLEHLNKYLQILTVPIIIHGSFWGHITYFFGKENLTLSQYDITIATSTAMTFGLGIYNYRLRQENLDVQKLVSETSERSAKFEKVKSEFLSNMNHEMRTPLSGILGFAELLAATDITETQRHYLDMITSSSKVLMNIIDDIIDISCYEKNEITIKPIEFSVYSENDSLIQFFTSQLKDAGYHFIFFVDPNIPQCLIGDPFRVKQALSYLVSNVVKFSPDGGTVSFDVILVSIIEDTCIVRLSVAYNGQGISIDKQQEMMRLFEQNEEIVVQNFSTADVGLTLCSKIIRALGGQIKLQSLNDGGSEFSFELTLKIPRYVENLRITNEMKKINLAHNSFELDIKDEKESLYRFIDSFGFRSATFNSIEEFEAINMQPDFIIFQYCSNNLGLLKTLLENERNATFIIIAYKEDLPIFKSISGYNNVNVVQLPLYTSAIANLFWQFGKQKMHALPIVKPASDNISFDIKVLVAEDNKVNRELLCIILSHFNIKADLAFSDKQALDIIRLKEYDLILIDINMPTMADLRVLESVRQIELEKNRKRSVIFALTSDTKNDNKETYQRKDIDDYIRKPINKNMIEEILRRHFMSESSKNVEDVVCNINQLIDNLGVDRETAFMLIEMFVEGLDEALVPINEAIKNNDLHTLHLDAHKLKGSSRNLGFEKFGMICNNIEQNAKSNIEIDYQEEFDKLMLEADRIRVWYKSEK